MVPPVVLTMKPQKVHVAKSTYDYVAVSNTSAVETIVHNGIVWATFAVIVVCTVGSS